MFSWTRWGILTIDGTGQRGSGISGLCWVGQKPRSQPEFQLASEARAVLRDWALAKLLQSCPTLCDPRDGSPPGSPIPGILQATALEWVAISFSNAWKWKGKVKSLSRVRLLVTPWTEAYQAPPSMGFSRQEYWGGVPLPSPTEPLTCGISLTLFLGKYCQDWIKLYDTQLVSSEPKNCLMWQKHIWCQKWNIENSNSGGQKTGVDFYSLAIHLLLHSCPPATINLLLVNRYLFMKS